MNGHAIFALAHPVFDPGTQILLEHFFVPQRLITSGLTVNIGLE